MASPARAATGIPGAERPGAAHCSLRVLAQPASTTMATQVTAAVTSMGQAADAGEKEHVARPRPEEQRGTLH